MSVPFARFISLRVDVAAMLMTSIVAGGSLLVAVDSSLPDQLPLAAPEGLQPDLVTARQQLPVRVRVEDKPLRAVRLFVSSDYGASWQSVGHQRPDENGALAPLVFSPENEGYYYLATQAIYQDGETDAAPVAGVASGILVLIDRSAPQPRKWEVLRKHDQALVMWGFDDVSTGTVSLEFSPLGEGEKDFSKDALPGSERLPSNDRQWQVLTPIGLENKNVELAFAGSARLALPSSGWVRATARDASGQSSSTSPTLVRATPPPSPPPVKPVDDGIPTAPVWPGWLDDPDPVPKQQRVRSERRDVDDRSTPAPEQSHVPEQGQAPSQGYVATAQPIGGATNGQQHQALRVAAAGTGPVAAAARVDLVLALLADGDAAAAVAAGQAAPPAQRSTALACAVAQAHLASDAPAAAVQVLAGVPSSSVRADEADFWRAQAEIALGKTSAGRARLQRLADGSGAWATRSRNELRRQ